MTYFADLTPYKYLWPEQNTVNVGWLSVCREFPKGDVDPEIIAKLEKLGASPTNVTRGIHRCEFCGPDNHEARGTGEIRVHGDTGLTYAAPRLIVHYIKAHQYLPPEEFLEAVLKTSL